MAGHRAAAHVLRSAARRFRRAVRGAVARLQREPAVRAVLPAGGASGPAPAAAPPDLSASRSEAHAEARVANGLEHGLQRRAVAGGVGGAELVRRGGPRPRARERRRERRGAGGGRCRPRPAAGEVRELGFLQPERVRAVQAVRGGERGSGSAARGGRGGGRRRADAAVLVATVHVNGSLGETAVSLYRDSPQTEVTTPILGVC